MRIVIFLIFSVVCLFGQSAQLELEKLQNKFQSVQNFSAEFQQISNSFGDKIQQKGKFYYAKGNKFKIEFGSQTICSNGKTIWNFNSTENRVVINNLDEQPGIFSIDQYIMEFSNFCDLGKIQDGIRLQNCKDNNAFYKSIDLKYDSDYMLKSVDIKDNMNNRYAFELKNIVENKMNDLSIFNYKIPEGARTIDLR